MMKQNFKLTKKPGLKDFAAFIGAWRATITDDKKKNQGEIYKFTVQLTRSSLSQNKYHLTSSISVSAEENKSPLSNTTF